MFATLPLPIFALGVKVGPDGCVYNVSTSLAPDVPGAFVWRICEPNAVEMVAELDQTGGPNDLAFASDGNLFVTDPVLGRIWKLGCDGTPEVFADHPLLDGNPSDPALVFRPVGVNGIAFDQAGTLFVAANAIDTLVAVSPERQVSIVAQGGLLDAPSSLVFGATRRDRDTLYLTSSAFSRTLGFQAGTPQPALLRASTPIRYARGRR